MHPSRALVSLAAAGALAAAAAGCGNSVSASTGHKTAPATTPTTGAPIHVTLAEWAVKPSSVRAAAGDVTFAVRNNGKVPHELVVLRTAKRADALGTGSRIAESGHAGETGDIAPGSAKTVTIRLPAGHYALVCNLPGHYMSGMHTDFVVG